MQAKQAQIRNSEMDASQRLQKQIMDGIGITQHSMADSGDDDSINYAAVKEE